MPAKIFPPKYSRQNILPIYLTNLFLLNYSNQNIPAKIFQPKYSRTLFQPKYSRTLFQPKEISAKKILPKNPAKLFLQNLQNITNKLCLPNDSHQIILVKKFLPNYCCQYIAANLFPANLFPPIYSPPTYSRQILFTKFFQTNYSHQIIAAK